VVPESVTRAAPARSSRSARPPPPPRRWWSLSDRRLGGAAPGAVRPVRPACSIKPPGLGNIQRS